MICKDFKAKNGFQIFCAILILETILSLLYSRCYESVLIFFSNSHLLRTVLKNQVGIICYQLCPTSSNPTSFNVSEVPDHSGSMGWWVRCDETQWMPYRRQRWSELNFRHWGTLVTSSGSRNLGYTHKF